MLTTDISVESLRELIQLKEKREKIQKDLDALDNQISKIASGGTAAPAGKKASGKKTPAKAKGTKPVAKAPAKSVAKSGSKPGKVGRRGKLSAKILTSLKNAGPEGVSIQEIADKHKVNPQNLYVWFSGTAKNYPEIKKVGRARYALIPDAGNQAPSAA